jgi:hypothetical protein
VTEESIRRHVQAALQEAISEEATRVSELFRAADAAHVKRVEMLRPLLKTLEILKVDVAGEEGVEISIAPAGHMASIALTSSSSNQRFSLSTSSDNSTFEIEEYASYSFSSDGPHERRHRFAEASEALSMLVKAVGTHIGSGRVVRERSK